MRQSLTPKQKHFLDYLKKYYRENEYMPSIREALVDLNLSSSHNIWRYYDILERKGYILRKSGAHRGVTII